MKKLRFLLLFVTTLLILLFPSSAIYASTSTVDDQAELFTEEERSLLTTKAEEISEKYNISIVILTTNSIPSDGETYLEDYYYEHYNKKEFNDAVLVLCDMGKRRFEIQGYESQETYLNNKRCDIIRDKALTNLKSGDYYQAFDQILDQIADYQGNHPNILMHTWCQLLIALIVGGVIVFVMVYNSKGKITTNSRTYLDREHSGLTAQRDIYLHTTVTKVKHEESESSSNSSDSGDSHSGSGGDF